MKTASIKKNYLMNVMLTVSSIIFPLVTFPYVSRVLLPDGTGRVAFVRSLAAYFTLFAQLGIPTYGIRACAGVREDRKALSRTVQELFLINMVTCAASCAAYAVMVACTPRLREDWLLCAVMGCGIFLNSIGMEWLYKALEKYTYIAVRSVIIKFLAFGAMFLLIKNREDYVIYGGLLVCAIYGYGIFNFINARRYISFRPVGGYHFSGHLKLAAVFLAMDCATTIYTNLDNVMLGFMTNDTQVGYYTAAVKIKALLVAVVTSLGTVLLPRAAFYAENNMMPECRRILSKGLSFVCLTAFPFMVYFILFAREGISFISGDAYAGAVLPMQLVMPTLFFIGITNILGTQMVAGRGMERALLLSELAGAGVDVVINLALIPRYGAAGAAAGTLAAEFAVLLCQCRTFKEEFAAGLFKMPLLNTAVGTGLGCLAVCWIKLMPWWDFAKLFLSAFVFFAVYAAYLFAVKEDIFMELLGMCAEFAKARSGHEKTGH